MTVRSSLHPPHSKMVKKKKILFNHLNLWKYGPVGNTAKETFIQENSLKLNKKSESMILNQDLFPYSLLPIISAKGELHSTLLQGRTQVSLSPQWGLSSWRGQDISIYHPTPRSLLLRVRYHQIQQRGGGFFLESRPHLWVGGSTMGTASLKTLRPWLFLERQVRRPGTAAPSYQVLSS